MLSAIPGTGRRHAEALLEAFDGSLLAMMSASLPSLAKVSVSERRTLGLDLSVAVKRALG